MTPLRRPMFALLAFALPAAFVVPQAMAASATPVPQKSTTATSHTHHAVAVHKPASKTHHTTAVHQASHHTTAKPATHKTTTTTAS